MLWKKSYALDAGAWDIRPHLSRLVAPSAEVGIKQLGMAIRIGSPRNEIGYYPCLAQGRDDIHS